VDWLKSVGTLLVAMTTGCPTSNELTSQTVQVNGWFPVIFLIGFGTKIFSLLQFVTTEQSNNRVRYLLVCSR
jgi:hypothetical protein